MNYAAIKNLDIANGPGLRVSLFVSGCTHRCPGCFNEIAWDFNYGESFTDETISYILSLLEPAHIEGLTLLGGEPFEPENQKSLLPFIKKVKAIYPNKTIWGYSGYTLDGELLEKSSRAHCDCTRELLENIDILVDGEFKEELKNLSLKFRGSSNQRIIDVQKSLRDGAVVMSEII